MLWAACLLGFFSFLTSGEMTGPEDGEFDPGQHLSFSDIAVDNPFRLGVTIFIGRTDTTLCPVAALLSYLALQGPGEGPLLRFRDGQALTRTRLVTALRKALAEVGLRPEAYAGHSFRIGAATTANGLYSCVQVN